MPNNSYNDGSKAKIAGVDVRVLKVENGNISSVVTSYPVENKQSVSDHVYMNPNEVSMQCVITNVRNGSNEASSVLAQFVKMRDNPTPQNIITEHALFRNMVLTDIRPVHEQPFKGQMRLDLTFRQVGIIGEKKMVSQGGRNASSLAGSAQSTGVVGQSAGQQDAKEVTPTQERIIEQENERWRNT